MLYGMDRENHASPDRTISQEELETESISVSDELTEIEERNGDENADEIVIKQNLQSQKNEPAHFTEKAASFLGTVVKGFYDIVVQILYQISQLFY